jgi:hypothetical protein
MTFRSARIAVYMPLNSQASLHRSTATQPPYAPTSALQPERRPDRGQQQEPPSTASYSWSAKTSSHEDSHKYTSTGASIRNARSTDISRHVATRAVQVQIFVDQSGSAGLAAERSVQPETGRASAATSNGSDVWRTVVTTRAAPIETTQRRRRRRPR